MAVVVTNRSAAQSSQAKWSDLMGEHQALHRAIVETSNDPARNEALRQYAAICYRKTAEGVFKVLLVTTRETGRWTIPKGWPIKGCTGPEVAKTEAWEEGGVTGKIKKRSCGYYSYLKRLDIGTTALTLVQVYPLAVQKLFDKFPECKQRQSKWVTPAEAADLVDEPQLKGLLVSFSIS
jgi:8-oxo-dGTP pyrophosphatase MutT (NUDIX family)